MAKYRFINWILSLLIIIQIFSCGSFSHEFKKRENKKIIRTSKKLMGVPYKTGGEDKSGVDCSGLLFYSYTKHDFQIPRVTNQQQNFGKEIPISKAKKGDWVMFATGNTRTINHIGLILNTFSDGTFEFIHSSTSKGVRIDQIQNSYWQKAFVKIVRPQKVKKN